MIATRMYHVYDWLMQQPLLDNGCITGIVPPKKTMHIASNTSFMLL
jgi:hypothetical protein